MDFSGQCNLRTTRLFRNMRAHGEVSSGTAHAIEAVRMILGRKCIFYRNGTRQVIGENLTEQESHDSEVLRFAHASILTGGPVGDKRVFWIDASLEDVQMWFYGKPMKSPNDILTTDTPRPGQIKLFGS